MATYTQVQRYVRDRYGFLPKTCWIAHVLADHGLTTRIAVNRKDPERRVEVCPERRRPVLEAALKELGRIPSG
jgi:hypothetical protein